MVTVGSILGGTFRFVGANIRSIALWTILSFVAGFVMRVAMAPFYEAQLASAAAMASGLPAVQPPTGAFLLAFVPMMILMLVLYNAVFRAVLFPGDSKAAYLRLGMDEVRLLGLLIVLFAIFFVGTVLLGILIGIVGVIFALLVGMGNGGSAIALFAVMVVIWGAMLFFCTRLAVAAPLTLYSRKIVIGPAWRLTKGRFWTLFGAYLVVGVGMIVLAMILMFPSIGPMLSAMAQPGNPEAARRVAELQAQQMQLNLSPLGIVKMIVYGAFGGVMLAICGGMPAVATAQLLDEKAGLL